MRYDLTVGGVALLSFFTRYASKTKVMKQYLMFTSFFVYLNLAAQPTYLLESDLTPASFYFSLGAYIKEGHNNELFLYAPHYDDSLMTPGFACLKLNDEGGLVAAKHISIDTIDLSFFQPSHYDQAGDKSLVSFRVSFSNIGGFSGFCLYDFVNDSSFGKKIPQNSLYHDCLATFVSDQQFISLNIVSVSGSQSNYISSYSVEAQDLNLLWSYSYIVSDLDSISFEGMSLVYSAAVFPNGDISILFSTEEVQLSKLRLLRIDSMGNIINAFKVELPPAYYHPDLTGIAHFIDSMGNIIIGGSAYPFGAGENKAFVLKLSETGEFKWVRYFEAENFDTYILKCSSPPSGEVFFTFVATGNLPVIFGKLSPEGDLEWYKGLSFYRPVIYVNSSGSTYFSSQRKYYEDGSWEDGTLLIARADSLGEIENCPQYEACLDVVEGDFVETVPLLCEKLEKPPMEDLNFYA
ncbi:hypothetical protein, partial [Thermodesulfatator atlanticus]